MSNWTVVQTLALLLGVLGPLVMLVRDMWRPNFFDFIWKRRSIVAAVLQESALIALVGAMLWAFNLAIDALKASVVFTQSPTFFLTLGHITQAILVALSVSFLASTTYWMYRSFRHRTSDNSSERGKSGGAASV